MNATSVTQPPMTRPLTSASRTLQVLDAIAEFRGPFHAPELAAALGWSRATTYQQLVTLLAAGWLERGTLGEYRLSVRAARLSAAVAAQAGPSERLTAELRSLVDATREAATVALLDGAEARVLWRVVPERSIAASVPLAATLTPRSASGQVLLAHLPRARRDALRAKHQIPAERTLAAVRAGGHAVYRSTDADGVAAIAAPIFGSEQQCVAALALTGPTQRFEPESALEQITGAARLICQMWQYLGDPAESIG
jgi:IclR family transcriptional regulator, acetate operon repressor